MREFPVPEPCRVDAYQAGHFEMIPPGMENFQCGQSIYRKPLHYGGDEAADMRIISAGVAPFVLLNLQKPVTHADLKDAEEFYNDFHADLKPPYHKPYPWPKAMWKRVVEEYNGFLPIVVSGLRDGQAHFVGEPHVQVWTDAPGMGELAGWIESTMLPYFWPSSTVATRGRLRMERMMEVYKRCYPSKTEEEIYQMILYKFHDFGRRGAAASQITGIAHLIVWLGTDTVDAAYAAAQYLNNGEKFGACSLVAAAHRTITPWPTELDAIRHMVNKYSKGIFSVVADSYNYRQGMEYLAQFAEIVKIDGGFLVGRPDSGDPVECILDGLHIFEKGFGTTKQELGLKVLNHAGIIQGDGVSDRLIFEKIYPAVIAAGFCPSNIALGMGEYNHRCVRSDMEEGYKTCLVGTEEKGKYREVMKSSESLFKRSLPCPVALDFSGATQGNYVNRVKPISPKDLQEGKIGDLFTYYDGRNADCERPKINFELFKDTRKRAYESWKLLPKVVPDTFDPAIRQQQKIYMLNHQASGVLHE